MTISQREPSAIWLENGKITPLKHYGNSQFSGAVYGADGRLCELSLRHSEKAFFKHRPNGYYAGDGEPVAGTFLYGGIVFDIFGHDLFEMPTRLWPLVKGQKFDGVIFHSWKANVFRIEPSNSTVRHVLNCFGILPGQILTARTNTLQVERLLVPEICFKIDDYALSAARTCFDWIRKNTTVAAAAQRHERIYFSRAKLGPGRTFAHEPLIEEAAVRAGFAVIHPQELPLSVQISMMDHARAVCGMDGSAMHLIAFADRRKAHVLCFNARKRVNTNQRILESLADADSVHFYVGDKDEGQIREMLQHISFN